MPPRARDDRRAGNAFARSATAVGDFSRIISGLSSTSRRETVAIF
ncbi:MAG: hypothetical protein ACLVB5_07485 [Christensenellales bacterium]